MNRSLTLTQRLSTWCIDEKKQNNNYIKYQQPAVNFSNASRATSQLYLSRDTSLYMHTNKERLKQKLRWIRHNMNSQCVVCLCRTAAQWRCGCGGASVTGRGGGGVRGVRREDTEQRGSASAWSFCRNKPSIHGRGIPLVTNWLFVTIVSVKQSRLVTQKVRQVRL